MNNLDLSELLRDYAENRSEEAFSEIVRRHIDFVYSVALRMSGDADLADDVVQQVFISLAQNAQKLKAHPVLTGWLHQTARNIAGKLVRSDVRRRAREREVAIMKELHSTEAGTHWDQVAPHIDTALSDLIKHDRDALLLRFFQGKTHQEIGRIMGISDDAAQKRISRALDRLKDALARRGIVVGTSGFGALISANAIQIAPAGLHAVVTASALSATSVAAITTTTATKAIAMTTLQKTLITTAIAAAIGTSTALYQAHQSTQLRHQLITSQEQKLALADEVTQLRRERDEALNRLASLGGGNPRYDSGNLELLRLRGEVNRLRNEASDPAESEARGWKARMDALQQRLAQTPAAGIPEFRFLSEKDWLDAVKVNPLKTEKDYREAFSKLRFTAESIFGQRLQKAVKAYEAANNGLYPNDLSQLQPYFESQVEDALLRRYEILPAQSVKSVKLGGDWIVALKLPVDLALDDRLAFGPNGVANFAFIQAREIDTLVPAMRAFSAANNEQNATDPVQLRPYVKTPEQEAALNRVIESVTLR